MMKFLNKKRKVLGNKGFSLVELIIVIAIMAVLMAVLAPQLIKYVEKSRVQADDTFMSELKNVVQLACSEDAVYSGLAATNSVVWSASGGGITVNITDTDAKEAMEEAIEDTLGGLTGHAAKSNTYKNATPNDYTIDIAVTDGTVTYTETKPGETVSGT